MYLRAVVMRVSSASVEVEGTQVSAIGTGFLVLLGVTHTDTEQEAEKLASKITGLRVFEDESGKMNRSLEAVGGSLLVVSQFTLYGNCKRGKRPEFLAAARPDIAVVLYESFLSHCKMSGIPVEAGVFGAEMKVISVNDGPVTLLLDTDAL